jgi:hypothetical protein
MNNIKKLKTYLKENALTIRETRIKLKNTQRGIDNEFPTWKLESKLSGFVYDYRHHHIAYCELRGKTRLQIEQKVKKNNEPSESYISDIQDKYAWSQEEIEAFEARKERTMA